MTTTSAPPKQLVMKWMADAKRIEDESLDAMLEHFKQRAKELAKLADLGVTCEDHSDKQHAIERGIQLSDELHGFLLDAFTATARVTARVTTRA